MVIRILEHHPHLAAYQTEIPVGITEAVEGIGPAFTDLSVDVDVAFAFSLSLGWAEDAVQWNYDVSQLEFDIDALEADIREVDAKMPVLRVSSTTGEGIDKLVKVLNL